MRTWIVVSVIAASGCHHSPKATTTPAVAVAQPAPAPAPKPAPAPQPAPSAPQFEPLPCEHDPGIEESAAASFACARAEYDEHNYDAADTRATMIVTHFPYSKRAVSAQELLADIMYARGRYSDAQQAYAQFVHDHPAYPEIDAIKRKLAEATEKASGTTGVSPITGR